MRQTRRMDAAVLALALFVLSLVLLLVGLAGRLGVLPRNRWIGVRAAAVRENDETWQAGHRASAAALLLAAVPPALVAAALVVEPPAEIDDWLLSYAVAGVVTGGLIALAVRQADRAARAAMSRPT